MSIFTKANDFTEAVDERSVDVEEVFVERGLRGDFGRADVFEWKLPPAVLDVLLKDRTTGRNIVWGTRDYERAFGVGTGFGENDEIRREQIADRERPVIRPRVVKDAAEQRRRSVDHAEVFTPSWVCNAQNNLVDAA